jgi:hypothetical protein
LIFIGLSEAPRSTLRSNGKEEPQVAQAVAKARAKAIDWSLRPSDFAPAFGRVVAASRLEFRRGAEAPLYLKSKTQQQDNCGGKSNYNCEKQNTGILRCAQNDDGEGCGQK